MCLNAQWLWDASTKTLQALSVAAFTLALVGGVLALLFVVLLSVRSAPYRDAEAQPLAGEYFFVRDSDKRRLIVRFLALLAAVSLALALAGNSFAVAEFSTLEAPHSPSSNTTVPVLLLVAVNELISGAAFHAGILIVVLSDICTLRYQVGDVPQDRKDIPGWMAVVLFIFADTIRQGYRLWLLGTLVYAYGSVLLLASLICTCVCTMIDILMIVPVHYLIGFHRSRQVQ